MQQHNADVIVIGAGLAGLVTALELAQQKKHVLIVDSLPQDKMGGLANWAFGGMALVGTPEQKSKKIIDTPEIALSDWMTYANFTEQDYWPKQWAEHYINRCIPEVYEYIRALDIKFLPAVNWAERSGNTVPRYHILWGCSLRLVTQLKAKLASCEHFITTHFNQKVEQLIYTNGRISGCASATIEFKAASVVIATGGFGGSLAKVKKHWPKEWSPLKQSLLNGCHPTNDGNLAEHATALGAQLTQMHHMWNYPAGIAHPTPKFDHHGLSLIPSRSALWVDASGQRIMPPLIGGSDTVKLCHITNELQDPYTWQILNRSIALKEFVISGSEHNPSIRDRKILQFAKELLFGNRGLVDAMSNDSDEFIVADDLQSLYQQMSDIDEQKLLSKQTLINSVQAYDQLLATQNKNDPQVSELIKIREYLPDKLRTLKPQSMLDKPPLIALKLRLISRKSMGGLLTNLNSEVLDAHDQPIPGLYAVGESAGFGGGGASGEKSLEGTFLSGCILTGRQAARSLL